MKSTQLGAPIGLSIIIVFQLRLATMMESNIAAGFVASVKVIVKDAKTNSATRLPCPITLE